MSEQPKKTATVKAPVVFRPLGHEDKVPLALSHQTVRDLVLRGQSNAASVSDEEIMAFLEFCRWKQANPLEGDAYLIKYEVGKPASFVLGIHHFDKLAELDRQYDGCEAGIVFMDAEGNFSRREGSMLLPGEMLVGGWAKAYKKNRRIPIYKEVALSTYQKMRWDKETKEKKPMARWADDPAGMICKVARAQAKREACPAKLSGAYIEEELEHTDRAPLEITYSAEDEQQALAMVKERLMAMFLEYEFPDVSEVWAYLESVLDEYRIKKPDLTEMAFLLQLSEGLKPTTVELMKQRYAAWLDRNRQPTVDTTEK